MSMLTDRSPYSFVADPSVPSFDPPDHFIVMSAHCGLCARFGCAPARHERSLLMQKRTVLQKRNGLPGHLLVITHEGVTGLDDDKIRHTFQFCRLDRD